jgi:methyl-accepting chemotaxis protein
MEEQSQALLDQVAFFNNGEDDEQEIQTPVRRSQQTSRRPASRQPASRQPTRAASRQPTRPAPRARVTRTKTESDQEWEEF